MESNDIGQWKKQYDDERFREQLGLSSTVLVSREPSSDGVFTFHLAKGGPVFRRTMSDSIDVSATLHHARWFDDCRMIDEILFENLAFLWHGPSDGASGPDRTGEGSEHAAATDVEEGLPDSVFCACVF